MNRARRRKRHATQRKDPTGAVDEKASHDAASVEEPSQLPWHRGTFSLTLASGVLLWAAFPPLDLWPLAWVAPLLWLVLIRRDRLGGKRPYLAVWLGCTIHWLIMLYGIRLAHPVLNLGWVAMSAYLAAYPAFFIGLTRVAVHRLRISIVFAAPIVWTGMELARGHAITGFSMALLGHTQVRWTTLIQVSDILGAYGVSFLVMLVAACIARMLPTVQRTPVDPRLRPTLWPLVPSVLAVAAALAYGVCRQGNASSPPTSEPALRVALIQCSFDTSYESDPEKSEQMYEWCREQSLKAVKSHPDLDLVVWPESAFTGEWADVVKEGDLIPPEEVPFDKDEYQRRVGVWEEKFKLKTRRIAAELNAARNDVPNANSRPVHLLAGTTTHYLGFGETRRYNSALFIDPDGHVLRRYHKMHLVPFGEYILLGDVFPWVYRLTPMPHGLNSGEHPASFELPGVRMAPSICFESTVPHLIRWQIASLRQSGESPDILVNITNDGWFRGASILDFQLACAVFRAVENRLPVLVAANTGFSAFVDADGRIVQQGPRRQGQCVYAEVHVDGRRSWYQQLGDLPAGACLLFCAVTAICGTVRRLRRPKGSKRTE